MAYAYSQVDELLGQQNQNIFGQPQGQGPAQGQQQPQATTNQPAGVKTSTEGDLNAVQPNAGTSQGSGNRVSTDQQGRNSAQRAISANVGKTARPAALQNVQQGIDDAQSGLAARATQYKADQAAKNQYGVDQGTLDRAVNQDSDAASKTTELLRRQNTNAIDKFDAGDLNVKDADLLNTNAGLKNLASRGQSVRYNPGMASFDTMLLQADPAFRDMIGGLKKQAADLKTTGAKTAEQAQKDAEAAAKASLGSAQTSAKDYLGGLGKNITDENLREAQAATSELGNLDRGSISAEAQKKQSAAVQAALDSIYGKDRASSQLADVKIDPSQFVNFTSEYNPDQFWSDQDATRFNSINQLLGSGGQSAMASGARPDAYKVDETAMYNAMMNPAAAARDAKDVANKKSIEEIMGGAQKRADDDDYKRANFNSNYNSELNKLARGIIPMSDFDGIREKMDDQTLRDLIGGYSAQNPLQQYDLGAQDVLNSDEATRLNDLAKDTGLADVYGAGQYTNGVSPQIDTPAFRNYLIQQMQNYRKPTYSAGAGGLAPINQSSGAPQGSQSIIDQSRGGDDTISSLPQYIFTGSTTPQITNTDDEDWF